MSKEQQTSDWEARPLTQQQLRYAIGDTTAILAIYNRIVTHPDPAERVRGVEAAKKAVRETCYA